ncbi:MAG: VTT domain-containing protein [Candidatus Gracilibacteria bacterium]|nr:VTT domain-containing protein [Candidatus Gracilibacteria bacterium]
MTSMKRFLREHFLQIITFIFWLAIIYLYFHYKIKHDLTNSDIAKSIYFFIKADIIYGGFIYIGVYILRTIIFVPASLLVILSPSLFGFTYAFIYTVIGENISAVLGYYLGNFFGKILLNDWFLKKFMKLRKLLKKETFGTIVISRLLFLPFDAINYLSGFLRLNFKQYFLGTFFGIIPGILMLLFVGSSIKNVDKFNLEHITIEPRYIIYAAFIFIIPLIAYYLYRFRGNYKKI